MPRTNNDFTVIKGKGLHNFSIRPANADLNRKDATKSEKNKKPE